MVKEGFQTVEIMKIMETIYYHPQDYLSMLGIQENYLDHNSYFRTSTRKDDRNRRSTLTYHK